MHTKENPLQPRCVSVFMHSIIWVPASFLWDDLGFPSLVCWLCPQAPLIGSQTPATVPGPVLFTTVQKGGVYLLSIIQQNLWASLWITANAMSPCPDWSLGLGDATHWLAEDCVPCLFLNQSQSWKEITPSALGDWGLTTEALGRVIFTQTIWLLHDGQERVEMNDREASNNTQYI